MAVEPKYREGRLVGYSCRHGHTHGNTTEAAECEQDPTTYTEEQRKAKKEEAKQREAAIRNDASFDQAVAAASELGADDDEEAEAVVIANGVQTVLNVRDSVRKLKIPSLMPKPKTQPKDDKGKAADDKGAAAKTT